MTVSAAGQPWMMCLTQRSHRSPKKHNPSLLNRSLFIQVRYSSSNSVKTKDIYTFPPKTHPNQTILTFHSLPSAVRAHTKSMALLHAAR